VTRALLALDIGGTNVRASIAPAEPDATSARGPGAGALDGTRRVSQGGGSKSALLDFVSSLVGDIDVEAAVLAFAGPVSPRAVRMTNWPQPRQVSLDELVDAGLPARRTRLVNDMAAGVLGVHALLEAGAERAFEWIAGPGTTAATAPTDTPVSPWAGSLVYVAPGTGLGAASLVNGVPVGCEAQHTTMPHFDGQVAVIAGRLREVLGHEPSWEEFVSGRGLAAIHAALATPADTRLPADALDDARAPEVVAAASRGDRHALHSVQVYYRCAARFAQLVTLASQPCAGVFLGGASTLANRDFIVAGGLAASFAENPVMGDTLIDVPVALVLEPDVNLIGGLAEARRALRTIT